MNTKPVNLVIFSRYCRTILVVKRHYPRVFSLVCEEFLHTVRGRQHGDHSFDPGYIPTPKIVSKTVAYSRYGGDRRQKAKVLPKPKKRWSTLITVSPESLQKTG